jgi:hypothetical protein
LTPFDIEAFLAKKSAGAAVAGNAPPRDVMASAICPKRYLAKSPIACTALIAVQ